MKTIILAAAAAIGLSGCVGAGGYGSGISIGYGNGGYGSGGYGGAGYGSRYGYNGGYGYNGYGGSNCLARDRFGRAYYVCGFGNSYGSNRYSYSPRNVVYYYPGYTYRSGQYYDRFGRRYSTSSLYDRYYRRYR